MKLTSEQLFAPPDSAPIDAPVASEACPKCGKNLIDPVGLGWCPGCGFCKSLANDGGSQLLKDKQTKTLGGVVEAGEAVSGLPVWFWASWVFIAAGLLFAVYMNSRLPAGDNLQRAVWSAGQIGVGLFIAFLAQFCAVCMLAPEVPTLSFKDSLVSFRLWSLAIKRMPKYKECLWATLLGISLAAGSAIFIGGFNHWFSYLPKNVAEREKAKGHSGGGDPIAFPTD